MPRAIPVGEQNFAAIRENDCFYVDKTHFISEWWQGWDRVTLITRPRRFGKTLMLDTVRTFFSPEFRERPELFAGLSVEKDEKLMALRGAVPVIFLSFADIKGRNYAETAESIKAFLVSLYNDYRWLAEKADLSVTEKEQFNSVCMTMSDSAAQRALQALSKYLERFYGIKPIILLDEYDTPMQEAWLKGFWDELIEFLRGFFNATFKTNPYLGRGLMTGITRVSKESLFSDLNNLEVVTVTTKRYGDCFGFTEEEVFATMDEYGLPDKAGVKEWYDGFIFGGRKDIYNPWSIIGYLSERQFSTYWVDTSSNALVGELLRKADADVKTHMEDLLRGQSFQTVLDEQIVFSQLPDEPGSIWSLLIAAGYMKVLWCESSRQLYEIALTNHEVRLMMEKLIRLWFNSGGTSSLSAEFRRALTEDRTARMNTMLNEIALRTFSNFDVKGREPERFYHGFVLGLIVDMQGSYTILSNRESGYGRYDVMLIPADAGGRGIILEFKSIACDEGENTLQDSVAAALKQIREKNYAAELLARGIPAERIYAYGIAFQGKQALVAGGKAEI